MKNYPKTTLTRPKTPRKGDTIHFWWSASEVASVTFVRWCRMRRGSGCEDTNKIQTGAIVRSDWRFSKVIVHRVPHGLRRGFYRVSPYTELYRSYRDARCSKNPIRRPHVSLLRKPRQ